MPDDFATLPSPVIPAWTRAHQIELRACVLVVEEGPDGGKRFGPLGEQTTIGRHPWSDIGLSDPQVSKEHCELVWNGDVLCVRDLGSTNGVFCNTRACAMPTWGPAPCSESARRR